MFCFQGSREVLFNAYGAEQWERRETGNSASECTLCPPTLPTLLFRIPHTELQIALWCWEQQPAILCALPGCLWVFLGQLPLLWCCRWLWPHLPDAPPRRTQHALLVTVDDICGLQLQSLPHAFHKQALKARYHLIRFITMALPPLGTSFLQWAHFESLLPNTWQESTP